MARWLLVWTLFISVATAGSYLGTNAVIGGPASNQDSVGMLPLADGGPGTTVCRRAQRAFIDAGAGAEADATPELQAAWARAARGVLQACATA
jgi:hypothetical protein